MSSIETRENAATGTVSYRVRFRHEHANRAVTFVSQESADNWRSILDALGPVQALAILATPEAAQTRTVAEQVAWHIDHLTGVTRGTRSDYRAMLKQDIAPALGDVPLPLLTRDQVASWVNYLADTRGLAGKSIRHRQSLLSAALSSALRDGLIETHPIKGMRIPRTDHERREMVFLTRAEFARLLAGMNERWHPLCILLVATGIRWGEATALQVGDVDLTTRTARIRQAWKHTDGKGHELGPPKSRRSRRAVSIDATIVPTLAPLLEGRSPDEFVFTNTRGGPVRQNTFHGDVWTPAVRKFAGDTCEKVPTKGRPRLVWTKGNGKRPRIHDLRHTYASWAIAKNVPMTVIQRSMGHESIVTTIDTYGHLQRADYEAAARATSPLALMPADESPAPGANAPQA
jgi:integrase